MATIFSYFFKQYKLGPLIGERTWGGVRGIRGEMPLMDGGYITRPEFSLYGLDSKWLIENHGVHRMWSLIIRPDLVVKGQDAATREGDRYADAEDQVESQKVSATSTRFAGLSGWARTVGRQSGRPQSEQKKEARS